MIRLYSFSSPFYLQVPPCAPLAVCLAAGWEAKTVNGTTTINGTLDNNPRPLGGSAFLGLLGPITNPRGADVVDYGINIDDAQFLTDPSTSLPYVLTCDQIVGVNPFPCGLGIPGDSDADRLAYFGSGSDGDAVNPTTISSDKQYNTLTVQNGHTFDPAGFTVRVKGLTLVAGNIVSVGALGHNAVADAGGTGGPGQDGAAGGTGVGAQPTNVTAVTPTNGGNGGAGGAGGLGSSGAGGAARTTVTSPMNDPQNLLVVPISHAGEPSQAGSAGAGDSTNKGGGGGEGAIGGNPINLYTRDLNIAATGRILSTGGAGGNGGNAVAGNSGGGGGAGGAGGGPVTIVSETSVIAAGGQVRSIGGIHGTGGTAVGTGVAGSSAADGGAGLVQRWNFLTGTVSGAV